MKDRVQRLQDAVMVAFNEAESLERDLQAEGLDLKCAEDARDISKYTLALLASVVTRAQLIENRFALMRTYAFEKRKRIYLIRRKSVDLKKALTWSEIQESGQNWSANDFYLLDVAKAARDRYNQRETDTTRKDRGFVAGRNVYQLWSYEAEDNSWTLIE